MAAASGEVPATREYAVTIDGTKYHFDHSALSDFKPGDGKAFFVVTLADKEYVVKPHDPVMSEVDSEPRFSPEVCALEACASKWYEKLLVGKDRFVMPYYVARSSDEQAFFIVSPKEPVFPYADCDHKLKVMPLAEEEKTFNTCIERHEMSKKTIQAFFTEPLWARSLVLHFLLENDDAHFENYLSKYRSNVRFNRILGKETKTFRPIEKPRQLHGLFDFGRAFTKFAIEHGYQRAGDVVAQGHELSQQKLAWFPFFPLDKDRMLESEACPAYCATDYFEDWQTAVLEAGVTAAQIDTFVENCRAVFQAFLDLSDEEIEALSASDFLPKGELAKHMIARRNALQTLVDEHGIEIISANWVAAIKAKIAEANVEVASEQVGGAAAAGTGDAGFYNISATFLDEQAGGLDPLKQISGGDVLPDGITPTPTISEMGSPSPSPAPFLAPTFPGE